MGALAEIIDTISDDVVAALALAGYPPLTVDQSGNAGAILVGPVAVYEQTSPPRIIFEPKGSKFVAAEYASNSAELDTLERRNQIAMRTIAGEDVMFDVHCWGAANTANPVDDYDVTRAIYHQIRASLQKLMPGAFEIEEAGKWITESNVVRNGMSFVFGVTFLTPVFDALVPYAFPNRTTAQQATSVAVVYAPDDVAGNGTETIESPDGDTEAGCE